MDLQFTGAGLAEGKFTGYIFASRCVPNKTESLIESGQPKRSALWVLEELNFRPYYFPRDTTGKGLAYESSDASSEIKCCESCDPLTPNCELNSNSSDCESIYTGNGGDGWLLKTYTILIQNKYEGPTHLEDSNRPECAEADPTDDSFIAEIVSTQENPSKGEENLIWGSGFLLTFLKSEIDGASAPFYLDLLFLKNTCESNAAYKSHCKHLAVGIKPDSQAITETGGVFKNMSEFLQLNVSKCSNYATGMDSTSIIEL